MLGGHFQEQSGHEAAEEIRRREAESPADANLRQAAMEHHADDSVAARSEGQSNADFAGGWRFSSSAEALPVVRIKTAIPPWASQLWGCGRPGSDWRISVAMPMMINH